MPPVMTPDVALVQRLPLPLAQLYRRAHNAKTPLERQLAAYYLWEASLQLLASVAIVEYAASGPADQSIAKTMQKLARPALGDWRKFVRLLIPALADRGDEPFQQIRALLLGKPRDDCPRAAGLDALLREALEGKAGARATVQFGELFDRLVTFRRDSLGHGAEGLRPSAYYERMGPALLAGVAEVLARLDVLAGRRLIHVADVRLLGSGNWLVERYQLHGEAAQRLESLEVPGTEAARPPRPGRLYLQAADGGAAWRSLHPLVVYDAETCKTFFFNSRIGKVRARYLCYTSGEVPHRDELGGEQPEFLAKGLGGPVDSAAVEASAAHGEEEPSVPEQRTLGEFKLISRLGMGGMGVVYRAWQPSLGREVALKVLLAVGDPKAEARFAREIRALGRVEHRNVVKVFTSGAEGEQWFCAMELVEGADLAAVWTQLANRKAAEVGEDEWTAAVSTASEHQRKKEKPLSGDGPAAEVPRPKVTTPPTTAERLGGRGHIARAVELVRQAAQAAHALHEADVVHRDIKPANIMVSADDGRAVLMDLGLAQLQDETQGRLTKTRQFVGTLRYASPEQLGGATLDRRADVYSLGATLWELLTLRPFLGMTDQMPLPDIILQVQQAEPERVRKYNARVPADLEAVVVKCLDKDRARRYATAADLAADLGRWQRGEPVLAQLPSLSYLLRKQARRYWVPLTAAALMLLIGVIGVVVAFLKITAALERETKSKAIAEMKEQEAKDSLERETKAKGIAESKEQEAKDSLAKEQKALADLKTQLSVLARSYCDRSDIERQKGNLADSLNWMLRAYEVAPKDDALRWSYRHLLAAQGRSLGRSLLHNDAVRAVAFSPDGRAVLTGSKDRTTRLWDVTTGKPLAEPLGYEDLVRAVAFSPDGRALLAASAGAIKTARLWDAVTGKPLTEPLPHDGWVTTGAISPDGRTLITGSEDGTARLWDVDSGKRLTEPLPHKGAVNAVAFSPDGRMVLTGSDDKTARLWEVATGKPFGDPLPHGGRVLAVVFSPDGHAVLTGSYDKTARLWDVDSGKPRRELLRHEGAVLAVAFSPDGRAVLTGSDDRTARLWDAATGKLLREPLHHEDWVRAVAFSPDGRTLLTGSDDKTARLWDAVTSNPLRGPLPHGGVVRAVAFSPDRRTALTGSDDKKARLWDAATGRPRGGPLPHEGPVWAVAFSPDGRTVLTGSLDKTARLWDAATGEPRGEPLPHKGPVLAVAFSPDGRIVLTGSQDEARLWDAATGQPLGKSFPQKWVLTVAFSPDGRAVFTGSRDDTARLWDPATGKPLADQLRYAAPVLAVAFSPDGRAVLTGGRDDTARLWDAATGKPLGEPLRHEGPVWAVAFGPDGRTVLTGGLDETARLWDAATGKPLGKPLYHEGTVWAVAFSPDGRTVLTGGDDKMARFWDIVAPAPDELPRLRAWVGMRTGKAFDDQGILRQLTLAEWLQCWQDFDANGGDWEPPPDGIRWHRTQAAEAEASGQWFAAVFHLKWLVKEDPANEDFRRRLEAAQAHLKPAGP